MLEKRIDGVGEGVLLVRYHSYQLADENHSPQRMRSQPWHWSKAPQCFSCYVTGKVPFRGWKISSAFEESQNVRIGVKRIVLVWVLVFVLPTCELFSCFFCVCLFVNGRCFEIARISYAWLIYKIFFIVCV